MSDGVDSADTTEASEVAEGRGSTLLVHEDPRVFLKAWLQIPPHSYGFLSRRCGVSKPHLANLVSGARRFTRASSVRIVAGLRLGEAESAYLLGLLEASDGRTSPQREVACERLPALRARLDPNSLSRAWSVGGGRALPENREPDPG